MECDEIPISAENIAAHTKSDQLLSKLTTTIKFGWSNSCEDPPKSQEQLNFLKFEGTSMTKTLGLLWNPHKMTVLPSRC